ncbi:Rus Holliday junction resolvase [uncultured Caudovirales phage]|uniref:Rus Holliday junction resolvase n=1 Tax=uncultured Caudovirales phage TaxID=2100421 RepID=A0A6J5RQC2_9CAUD|nr:Rus Holliday junction resolvase [uncultured Caudovirales phage]
MNKKFSVIKVLGKPEPQGSSRAFVVNGKPIITSANKNLKPWRTVVEWEARSQWQGEKPLDGAIQVSLDFRLHKPKSVKRDVPTVKPDLDKMIRSVLDALTAAHVWHDDAQVWAVDATKQYADEDHPEGVIIRIGAL